MNQIIRKKLSEIEVQENVKILLAVESGSRAWGFASPDSDFDVRFIYVRPKENYLKLEPVRDVAEWQLDETLDINGWDLQKALRLLYKSNPTVFEWCNSPIVYQSSPVFDDFKLLLNRYFRPKSGIYHYLNTAQTNYRGNLHTDEVKLKRYFYVLRPILACRWIIQNQTAPPMLFTELVSSQLEEDIKPIVEELLNIKMNTPEVGKGRRIDRLNAYIDNSIEEISKVIKKMPDDFDPGWDALNQYFLSVLQ